MSSDWLWSAALAAIQAQGVEKAQAEPERKREMTNDMTTAELEKIHAEIAKLMAETAKINRETMWYPVAVATGLIGAVATVTTIIIKFI